MNFINKDGIKYENFKHFKSGGMGTIYKGISPISNKMVIVKLIENIQEAHLPLERKSRGNI